MTAKDETPEIETIEGQEASVNLTLPRRNFLGAVAVAGTVLISQDGSAQTDGSRTEDDRSVESHFQLGGEIGGWQGRSPSEIEGQTNPTLNLQAGKRYKVTWENVDGVQHGFTILDANGNEITGTEITAAQGQTRSLTFTATREMDQYYCVIHTDRMRGDIQMGDGTPTGDTPMAVEGDVETVFELGGVIGGWQGRLPEARDAEQRIAGEQNPTLELEAGTRYTVIWENADGVPHNFTIEDADGNSVLATETISSQGETRSLTFTATRKMDQYVCTIHPSTMRGEIRIGGNGIGKTFTKGPAQMVGGLAAATVGSVVGIGYLLSRYFEESHEP